MELWVRSQDKMLLRKPEQLGIYEGNEVWFIGESLLIDYGKYKTKERALEVLDEIQKYLTPTIQMLDETIGNKQICQIGNILTFVYNMPQK